MGDDRFLSVERGERESESFIRNFLSHGVSVSGCRGVQRHVGKAGKSKRDLPKRPTNSKRDLLIVKAADLGCRGVQTRVGNDRF